MELVEGTTLRQLLARGRLPLKKTLQIASQLADALARGESAAPPQLGIGIASRHVATRMRRAVGLPDVDRTALDGLLARVNEGPWAEVEAWCKQSWDRCGSPPNPRLNASMRSRAADGSDQPRLLIWASWPA